MQADLAVVAEVPGLDGVGSEVLEVPHRDDRVSIEATPDRRAARATRLRA
jgi:hypothetical protein